MTALPPPDPDFEKVLTLAMDDFANDVQPPSFDGSAILRRTRRRRGVLTVTMTVAATVVLAGGVAFALRPAASAPAPIAPAAPGVVATPSPHASAEPTAGTPSPAPPVIAQPGSGATPQPGQVTVPSVLGMPQTQAEQTLLVAGLKVGHVQPLRDWKTPAGAMLSQEPRPGTIVAVGTPIDLFLSTGKP